MPRRTNYFNMGRFHHADDFLSNVNDREFDNIMNKFLNKFWGDVSSEQWQNNDLVANEDSGEIIAIYKSESGKEIHFITLEDRSFTIIASKKDLENGEVEKLKQTIEESKNRSVKVRRSNQFVLGA